MAGLTSFPFDTLPLDQRPPAPPSDSGDSATSLLNAPESPAPMSGPQPQIIGKREKVPCYVPRGTYHDYCMVCKAEKEVRMYYKAVLATPHDQSPMQWVDMLQVCNISPPQAEWVWICPQCKEWRWVHNNDALTELYTADPTLAAGDDEGWGCCVM